MANTRHIYQLHHSDIEELIRKNGLPDEISTEAQLWDLIIKKITYTSPQLLFPLIYEIYGKNTLPIQRLFRFPLNTRWNDPIPKKSRQSKQI